MPGERILVVEDHADTRNLLEYQLASAGFEVRAAPDGYAGLDQAFSFKPDLVLLDVMLPGLDGLEVLRRLRAAQATAGTPVILLKAKGEELDRVVGLELGADDYVVKPFSPRELVLRIKAVLRRLREAQALPKSFHAEGLVVDFEAHSVSVDGQAVELTATEFKLLGELVSGRGRVRTREHLLDTVWETHFEGYSRTVDTHVRRLRQKLGRVAERIETVRGVGYRFRE